MDKTRDTLIARLKKHYVVNARNCWMWKGTVDRNGFPKIFTATSDKNAPLYTYAARVAWEHQTNKKLEKNNILKRHCRSRRCINPDHHVLIEGGPNTKISKGEAFEIAGLFFLKNMAASLLASEYKITRQQVYNILKAYRSQFVKEPDAD